MKNTALSKSLIERLAACDAQFATQFADVVALQTHLPAWLLSISKLPQRNRDEQLRRAAHLFSTELRDPAAAAVLRRLARDETLFGAIQRALNGEQSSRFEKPIRILRALRPFIFPPKAPARTAAPGASLTAALLLLTSVRTHAATFTWDGGALLNSNWSQDNNWAGNNQPPSNGTADLIFTGSNRLEPDADAQWNIRSLTFGSSAGAFDITGSTLTIGSGGLINDANGLQRIANNLVLSAPQTFAITNDGNLDIQGTINNGGHLLTANAPTGTIMSFADTIAGTGGFTKTGGGTIFFEGDANTYGGVTTVSAGSLVLSKSANVAAVAGSLNIVGGSVSINANEQIGNSSLVTVGSAGQLIVQGTSTESVSTLTVNGGTVLLNAGKLSVANGLALIGGGTITSAGGGEFVLNGNISTTPSPGPATISATTLNLTGAPHIFDVSEGAAAADLLITSAMIGGSFSKNGVGTLRLGGTGANTSTFATSVNLGTVELAKSAGIASINGSLIIGDNSGAGTVRLLANEQLSSLVPVTIAAGTLDLNGFNETINTVLTMNGGVIHTGTGVLTLASNLSTTAPVTAPLIDGHLNLGASGRIFSVGDGPDAVDLAVNATISNGGITKTDLGTLTFGGTTANTFTGNTQVNAGELRLGKPLGVNAISGPLIIGDGVTLDTVRLLNGEQISNTSAVTINGALQLNGFGETIGQLTINGGTVLDTPGTGALTLNGDVIVGGSGNSQLLAATRLGGATRTFTVSNANASGVDLSVIRGFANGGIIKEGAGTMLINGTNTYAGGLTVNAGEVAFSSNNGAGTGTLTLNGGVIRSDGGARILTNAVTVGGSFTVGGMLEFKLSGPITLLGNHAINVANIAVTTLSGSIEEDAPGAALTKVGLGTLTISAEQEYSGLIVNSGAVNLQTPLGTGDSDLIVAPPTGGIATVNLNSSQTLSSLTIGDGGVVNLFEGGDAAPPEADATSFEDSTLVDEPAPFDANVTTLGVQSVPEPGGMSLLALGLLILPHRRARHGAIAPYPMNPHRQAHDALPKPHA